jgi:hypothetical protein
LNLETMVNTKLDYVQLFRRYISLVTTLTLDTCPGAADYCHLVRRVSRIVELCLEVFDHSVRMLSITEVLVSHEFSLRIWLWAQGGCPIITRKGVLCRRQRCCPDDDRGLVD